MKGHRDAAAIFRFIAGVKRTRADRKTIGVPIAWVLHFGVYMSVILICAALFLFLIAGAQLGGPQVTPIAFGEVPSRLALLDPDAFLALGILLLLATPLARVLASVILYLRQRDLVFGAITLVVLADLLVGFFAGLL